MAEGRIYSYVCPCAHVDIGPFEYLERSRLMDDDLEHLAYLIRVQRQVATYRRVAKEVPDRATASRLHMLADQIERAARDIDRARSAWSKPRRTV
jgi:hypothetical protein